MAEENYEENLDDEAVEYEENEESTENEEIDPRELKSQLDALKEEKEKVAKYMDKYKKEAQQHRLKAKAYEEAGMSPEEIKELREKQEKAKQRELEKKGDIEKIKQQLQESHQKEIGEYEDRLQRMQKSLETNLIQKEVTSAISEHEGIPKLLRPHVESAVKLFEEDDGTMVPRVLDEDGSPKFNGKGDYMSVSEYVASLREDDEFGVAFKGRNQSGAGTRSSNGGNGAAPKPKKKRSDMSFEEKGQIIKEQGIDYYNSLPL